MNEYYNKILDFQEKLKDYAQSIFRTYGKELVLRLEEYNLLQNKHNCIESSTAIGFVLEEFLVSKLEMFTHCAESEYVIDRFAGATASESYDCFCISDNIKLMVNVKAENERSKNNAIAAIAQLYRNYCLEDPEQSKSIIIFKVRYSIRDAYEDDEYRRAKPRHIHIDDLETYCLEEIDFSNGHQQDNRSWSKNKSDNNNGRLGASRRFREDNRLPSEKISYSNTFRMIEKIYEENKKKKKNDGENV